MFSADVRLAVVPHATMGRACVATRRLRCGEFLYYWGAAMSTRVDTPQNADYLLTSPRGIVIDPTPFADSYMQFANACGPSEAPNVVPTPRDFRRTKGVRRTRGVSALASSQFVVVRTIERGEQVLWDYGGVQWFEERGLARVDVGEGRATSSATKNECARR